MTTYNTGNPLGSSDPRDLFDNAENLDGAVNSTTSNTWVDRLGVTRKTFNGMEQDFQQFLLSSGYDDLGAYQAGIQVTARNQIILSAGEYWRVAASTSLPYITTGAGMPEGGAFVSVGDATLRQDLTNPDKGAAMVARGVVAVESIADLLALPDAQRKEGLRYLVKGYHAGSDIGGGEFYWDSARAKTEHNGGTVIDQGIAFPEDWGATADVESWFTPAGSGSGCYVRLHETPLVTAFGAFADESYGSDRQFIASIQHDGCVRMPAGTFLLNAEIKTGAIGSGSTGINISGEGRNVSVIKINHAGNGFTLDGPGDSVPRSTLKDFSFRQGTIKPATLITVNSAINVIIKRVEIRYVNVTSSIICNNRSYGLTVEGCEVRYCSAPDGVLRLRQTNDESYHSYDINLIDTDITGVYASDSRTVYDGTIVNMEGGQLTIKSSVLETCGTAIVVGNDVAYFPMLVIENSYLENVKDYLMRFIGTADRTPNVSISGTRINNASNSVWDFGNASVSLNNNYWVAGDRNFVVNLATIRLNSNRRLTASSFVGLDARVVDLVASTYTNGTADGVPFVVHGVNVNRWQDGGYLLSLTVHTSAGNSTAAHLIYVRAGNGGGNFSTEALSKQIGTGTNNNDFVFTSDADGTLYAAYSGGGNIRYKIIN